MLPPAELLAAVARNTDGNYRPDVIQAEVDNGKRAITWLMDKGVEFVEPPGSEHNYREKVLGRSCFMVT